MVQSPRIANLLATAVQSFGDRRNISRRPPHDIMATAMQSFDDRQKNCGRRSSHYYIRYL